MWGSWESNMAAIMQNGHQFTQIWNWVWPTFKCKSFLQPYTVSTGLCRSRNLESCSVLGHWWIGLSTLLDQLKLVLTVYFILIVYPRVRTNNGEHCPFNFLLLWLHGCQSVSTFSGPVDGLGIMVILRHGMKARNICTSPSAISAHLFSDGLHYVMFWREE